MVRVDLNTRDNDSSVDFAVGIVPFWLGGGRLAERRDYYSTRAEVENDRADDFVHGRTCLLEKYHVPGAYETLCDYHMGLARKYRLAANRPWLAVEPDPHLPEP